MPTLPTNQELIAKAREGIKLAREDARKDLRVEGDVENIRMAAFFDGLDGLCVLCERQDARISELEERVLSLRRRLGRGV